MEKVREILRKSMMDLIREIRIRDDAQVKLNKIDPSPILSFDQYKSTFLPQTESAVLLSRKNDPVTSADASDVELNNETNTGLLLESPRFVYDYGFNPLIFLADCIERNSKV